MKEQLMLVRLDTAYCDYLRKFDDKVPYNYNEKELRPFVGVLFRIDKLMYFAPLSSPKPKHLKLKSKLDLDKECLTKSEEKYTKLLKEQIYWLNRNDEKLFGRSKKLYDKYINGTLDQNIAKRCCNFKLLEEKCKEYNN